MTLRLLYLLASNFGGRPPAALGSSSGTVALLVRGFGDYSLDPARPQQAPIGSGRVGLVTKDRIGAGTSTDFQVLQQGGKHRTVAILAGGADRDQRQPVTVDKLMCLC